MRYVVCAAVSIAFFQSFFSPACAQKLNIEQALKIALEKSPTIISERQEIRKAQGTLVQAQGNYLPSFTVSSEYSDGRYPSVSNGYRTDSTAAGLTITENIYSGGKRGALRRQAKAQLSQSESSIREAEESLAVDIYDAFYSVLLARETVAAAKDAVDTSNKHLTEVKHMLRLGLANNLEMIRAEQQLSSNEASLASANGSLDTSRINLLNLMGLSPASDYYPEGSLLMESPSGSIKDSVDVANKARADVDVLEKEIAIQKEQIEIARSSMRPQVDLSFDLDYENPYNKEDRADDSWTTTLSLDIPIYDRGQTRGEVMQAQATQEQNKQALAKKYLDISSEVEIAWIEIADSEAEVESYKKALQLARESLRLSQIGYREGVTPQLDLLEAQSDFTSARKDYSQSLFNHLMNIVSLKRAEGMLIPWTLGEKKQ